MYSEIKTMIRNWWRTADAVARGKAVDLLEHEVEELQNIFGLLVLGIFVGLPAPPIQILFDLMPEMTRELEIMMSKVTTAHDPLGEMFSVLSID